MARYRFPQDRSALIYGADLAPILTPPRTALPLYADQALTAPADVQDLTGAALPGSTVYVAHGMLGEFLGPDGVTRVWARLADGSAWPLDAQGLSVMAAGAGASSLHVTGIAAAALSGHRAVTPQADGTLAYASNDNPAHVQAPLWVTSGAASAGSQADALMLGLMTEPSWAWTPGAVYLGAAGVLTQSPPTATGGAAFLVQVGTATSPTSLYVDRGQSIKLTT